MKATLSLIIAAALVIPAAASAQRVTTPGTFDRHERNLEQAEEGTAEERRVATSDREEDAERVPAAKAGKVNTAASSARDGAPN